MMRHIMIATVLGGVLLFPAGVRVSAVSQVSAAELVGSDAELVCAAVVATVTMHPISIMRAYDAGDGYPHIEYNRPSDGELYRYKCKFGGDRVIRAPVDLDGPNTRDGRWFDSDIDETVTFQKTNKGITITLSFDDVPYESRDFEESELK